MATKKELEDMRPLMAAIILAGIAASPHTAGDSSTLARLAIDAADDIIRILSKRQ